jgi:hypothetical protein
MEKVKLKKLPRKALFIFRIHFAIVLGCGALGIITIRTILIFFYKYTNV